MSTYVFEQLAFVRGQTVKALQDVPEDVASAIPPGFRNSVLWHAGHIYLVQERFAFSLQGKEADIPASFLAAFAPGTSPASWTERPATLADLTERLRLQADRVAEAWAGRLHEGAPAPYTTSTGMTLTSTEAFLNFTLYHEGMHFQAIKMYKALLTAK
ncbi:MAG TPA: DinB family protein [Paenibacillus sp.]|nr:DinB family protein [Paenibacillus sp.]